MNRPTQSQVFCLGVVLLAIIGVSHKLRAQTASAPEIKTVAVPVCTDPSGACPLPDGFRRDVLGIPISAKVRAFLDEEELAKITAAVSGITPVTGTTMNTGVTHIVRRCDDGWTLVSTGSGYQCARELRDPK